MATASSTGSSLLGLLRTCALQESLSHFFREILKNKFMASIFVQWNLLKDQKKKKHFNFKFYEFYEQNKNDFCSLPSYTDNKNSGNWLYKNSICSNSIQGQDVLRAFFKSAFRRQCTQRSTITCHSVIGITSLINTFAEANSLLHFHRNLGSVLEKHLHESSACVGASASLESRPWVTTDRWLPQASLLARLSPTHLLSFS